MNKTSLLDHAVALGIAAVVAMGLSACGDSTNEALGLSEPPPPPNETGSLSQAPLSLPPEFHIRPTASGSPRPDETDVQDQAAAVVLGPNNEQPTTMAVANSPGEAVFLNTVGVQEADPDIREKLGQDRGVLSTDDVGFVDALMFAGDNPNISGDTPVIARKN
jgi:hypothetical protein